MNNRECSNCESACDFIIGAVTRCCECLGMTMDFCPTCDNRRQDEAEAANERFISAYYGGEVKTLDQEHREAWEEFKR